MKKRSLILLLSFAALTTGCFTKVSQKTFYVLKPWVKPSTSEPQVVPMGAGVQAYAFAADTAKWDVLSYEDALAGTITSRTTGETMQPAARGASYLWGGDFSLAMELEGARFLILAVDVQHKLYGFTEQQIGGNVPETYVHLIFYPEELGKRYMKGKWHMRNDFYVEPTPEPEPEEPETDE